MNRAFPHTSSTQRAFVLLETKRNKNHTLSSHHTCITFNPGSLTLLEQKNYFVEHQQNTTFCQRKLDSLLRISSFLYGKLDSLLKIPLSVKES
ncbi:MAG: hypothetical protein Solivirus6_3 [Solivirus sp.]|uniref:Uncharacterized protein n=1 Tax=Solivirus sp. TaxID=2487772 RepID=A0A3G5AHN3_9VIRU|nr:MAG: hypothetical protein Solivirus6_3 [Solivirus sp.]